MTSEITPNLSQTHEDFIDKGMKKPDEEGTEATVPITSPLLPSNTEPLTRQRSSSSSSSSKTSECPDICRICHCESTPDEPLISPCLCLGTMQYLHQACLQRWIKSAGVKSCELCKFEFIMRSEIKPFNQVRRSEKMQEKLNCSLWISVAKVGYECR